MTDAGFKSSPTGTRFEDTGVTKVSADSIFVEYLGARIGLTFDQIYAASTRKQSMLALALTVGDYAEAIRVAKEIA